MIFCLFWSASGLTKISSIPVKEDRQTTSWSKQRNNCEHIHHFLQKSPKMVTKRDKTHDGWGQTERDTFVWLLKIDRNNFYFYFFPSWRNHSIQDQMLAKRDCRTAIPKDTHLTGHSPAQAHPAGLALSRELHYITSTGPSQTKLFQDSTRSAFLWGPVGLFCTEVYNTKELNSPITCPFTVQSLLSSSHYELVSSSSTPSEPH